MPEKAPDSPDTAAASGSNSHGLLAKWDPATQSWKTSQLSLLEESIRFSGPWPTSGTMRDGRVYPQKEWVPLISETAFSSWPTPTAIMPAYRGDETKKNGRFYERNDLTLKGAAEAWSTPLEDDANNVTRDSGQKQSFARDSHRWSTPRAEDGERGENSQFDGLMEDARSWSTPNTSDGVGASGGPNRKSSLRNELKAWATPTEQDSSNNASPSGYRRNSDPLNVEAKKFEDGQTRPQSEEPTEPSASSPGKRLKRGLNPRFGLWLMGFPVEWLD
jgi:hypothetical protein